MVKRKNIEISCFPVWLNKVLSTKMVIILSNWTLQGMRYMNWRERTYRLLCEGLCIVLLAGLLKGAFIVIILAVHTGFWLFNGHFFVLMRYIFDIRFKEERFWMYVKKIAERMKKRSYVRGCVAFGSISRGRFSNTSDFDVRVISKPGPLSLLKSCNAVAYERFLAFWCCFPIDIYVFDHQDLDKKISPLEDPLIICDPEGSLGDKYKDRARPILSIMNKY